MRAAPALRIAVRPSPLAGVVVVALAAFAGAVAAWWLCRRLEAASGPSLVATLAAAGLAALAAQVSLVRGERTLDWDARQWRLLTPSAEETGEIAVAMDLGIWLLLRFRPLEAPRRTRWIALSRRGLEPHWHALRCAVYSPRPAAAASAKIEKNDRS